MDFGIIYALKMLPRDKKDLTSRGEYGLSVN